MYYKKTNKAGKVMYYDDTKLISVKSIPDGEPIIDRDFELPVETPASALSRSLNADVTLETVDDQPPRTATVNEVESKLHITHAPDPVVAPEVTISKDCAVCGKEGEFVKYLSGKTFYLCEDHYALNTGKLAQALRESTHG